MEGGGFLDPITNLFRTPDQIKARAEQQALDEESRKGREEEQKRQKMIDTGKGESAEVLSLPDAEPSVAQRTGTIVGGVVKSARNAFKKASKMIAKDEIIVLGERVVLKEEGFVPEKFNDRVSFQQKYFYTLQPGAELGAKRAIFEKYFNEASQMSADNPRPPCDLAEKQTLLEGLMNRFNTLRTEIRILSKQTPDSVDLRQRIDHAMRLKSFMEMLDSQPDCLSYDDKGRVSIINGDPTIKDEDLELLLKRFAVLVLQAKNPLATDTKVNQDFARQLVAKVQELGTLDDTGVKGYIGDRIASGQNLRTPEKFQQLIEGDPLVKAGSTQKELLELRNALWENLKDINGWDAEKERLEEIFKTETGKSEEERLKEQIAGSVTWIIKKYNECFEAIKANRSSVADKEAKLIENGVKINALEAEVAAAKAAVTSGNVSAAADLGEAQRKLGEANTANETLRVEIEGLKARQKPIDDEIKRLGGVLTLKDAELDAEKAKVAEKEAAALAAQEELARVQTQLDAAKEAAKKPVDPSIPSAELQNKYKTLELSFNLVSALAKQRREEADRAKADLAAKQAELGTKEAAHQGALRQLQEQIASLTAQIATKTGESNEKDRRLEGNTQRINELLGQLATARGDAARNLSLTNEINRLRGENGAIKAEKERLERLPAEIEVLRAQLVAAREAGGNKIPIDTIRAQIAAIQAALNAEGGPPAAALPALEGGPLADLYTAIQGFATKQKASIDSAKGYQLCYLNFIVTYFLKRFLKGENARTAVQSLERALDGILISFRDINGRKIFGDQETISADGYKSILDSIFPLLETTESLYLNGYLGPSQEPVDEGYYTINQYDIYAADRSKQGEARRLQSQINDIIYKLYLYVKTDGGGAFGGPFEGALKPEFKTSKTHVGFRPPFLPPRPDGNRHVENAYEYPYDKGEILIEHRNLFTRPIVIYIKAENVRDMNVDTNFRSSYGKWDIPGNPGNQFQRQVAIDAKYQDLVASKAVNIRGGQRQLLSYEFLFTFFLLVARRYLKVKGEDLKQQGCPLPRLLNGEMGDGDAAQYGKDVEGGPPPAGAPLAIQGLPGGPARPASTPVGPAKPAVAPAQPQPQQQQQQQQQQQAPPAAPAAPATSPIAALTGGGDATDADIKRRICLILRQISRASAVSLTPEMKEDLDTFQYNGQAGSKLFENPKSVIRNFNMKWSTQPTVRISFPSTVDQSTATKEPFVKVGDPCDADVTTFVTEYLKQFIPRTSALQSDYNIDSSKVIIKRLREFFQDMFVTYYYTYPIKNPDETNKEAKYNFLKNAFNNSLMIQITQGMIDNNNQFLGHRDPSTSKKVYHFKITSPPDTLAKYVAIGIPDGIPEDKKKQLEEVALTFNKVEAAKTNLLR